MMASSVCWMTVNTDSGIFADLQHQVAFGQVGHVEEALGASKIGGALGIGNQKITASGFTTQFSKPKRGDLPPVI